MKSFIKVFTASLLGLVCLFAGCTGGCTSQVTVNYDSTWFKNGSYQPNVKQVYTYEVNNINEFTYENYSFAKKDNEVVDVTFSNGSYVMEFNSLTSLPENLKGLVADYTPAPPTKFFLVKTNFAITVSYDYDGKVYTFNNTISSSCYFNETELYLQPIYHSKEYNTTTLNNKNGVVHTIYNTTVEYKNGLATLKYEDKTANVSLYENDDNYTLSTITNEELTIPYTKFQVLDNEELLFAVKALPLAKDYQTPINVLDTTHRAVKSVAIKVLKEETITTDLYKNFKINGTLEQSDKASVDTYLTSIILNEQFAGSPKFCYYQKGVKGTTDRGLLVKFIDRLPSNLGALEYVLTSVDITE